MYNTHLHFHFIGVGGSGMSGLAEILVGSNFSVSGSDLKLTSVTDRLQKLGVHIFKGHTAENLPARTSVVVYSSAVDTENSEILEAERRGLPIIRRAEVLAELMRLKFGVGVAGAHGKTTTTSLTACILEEAALDPTVIIGGQLQQSGTGARVGQGRYLVAETDESDRSFLLLKPTIAIVTNIDAEHLSAYSSFQDLEEAFAQFVQSVPFYGLAVLCIDDARLRTLASRLERRVITYGFSPDADLQPRNVRPHRGGMEYEVLIKGQLLGKVHLQIPGEHMVLNSLAAIAVAKEFGVADEVIVRALGAFGGVKRRLETVGIKRGIRVMTDYGHHPTEVRATLRALKHSWDGNCKRLRVIFQPHRYSRTRDCFAEFLDAFTDADTLTLTDIYAAHEPPLAGISGQSFADAVRHKKKNYLASIEDAGSSVAKSAEEGDCILCLGAGTIGALPEQILAQL